ncbi:tRNA (adenosine(37)-N6)-threonylcarbamoyltransferase complex ATPase subunit type 1 TsaE [Petrocella sp. FN5]|uniref:tRNA (adenosine(37)-N6)-threonylcarbamoyltransferase complex ATPase subunit type 1 TsaE n=1 Tax=Petrocella sp. FN5 TaxID=3032002 RepID=UPI0023DBAA07|nr:tRNA (adenosine(37)-N6)-threonylcarbamoyltransferase complex ATPase subunit type 1 TsaE [Petrocella sp. FN5]MDF1615979.1 tRNA (adenosine(37)-N6)-threonylcarbamoyltransferase complex ATPase subunit type 1 TsaE [Petrocella sp. FN5]
MTKIVYESKTEAETQVIGETLGKAAKSGEIYCLDGELGVGKTVFTKGFARGLQIHDHVTSPTFTIMNIYENGRLDFYHFDVYRITDPYELDEIGYEDYFYGQGVTMIEWASRIDELIPKEAKYITIKKDLSKGLDYRTITIEEGE